MWGLAASLAIRHQELARRHLIQPAKHQEEPLGNRERFKAEPEKEAPIIQPISFFKPRVENPKMTLDEFLGAILQKIHPTLFRFWQRTELEPEQVSRETSKHWYA